jgi:two-component system OmpR family sensor kinase
MGKLFLSLYIYIIISIFVLSGALEKFWPAPQGIDSLPLGPEVGHSINALANSPNGLDYLHQIYKTVIIQSDQIAFLPKQTAALEEGVAVPVFSSSQKIFWYLKLDDKQLLRIGPYYLEANTYDSLWPFFIMLLLIGLPVATWCYWLWRDFNQLASACNEITAPENLQLTEEGKSLLLPIKQTLILMKKRIQHLLDSQSELTSSVSHEFRTPLSRINFALAILENTQHDEKSKMYVENMQNDVREIDLLVSEMLEYARFEREKPLLNIKQYNLFHQTKTLVEKLSFNTDIAIKIHSEKTILLAADAHFIERATQNLIGNALKFAKEEVHIYLSACSKGITIKVADDGIGIEENERDNIFKPFTRLDKSRNKNIKGFGMGLAIVQKITKWHNGKCFVEQSSFGGACFVLFIPQ